MQFEVTNQDDIVPQIIAALTKLCKYGDTIKFIKVGRLYDLDQHHIYYLPANNSFTKDRPTRHNCYQISSIGKVITITELLPKSVWNVTFHAPGRSSSIEIEADTKQEAIKKCLNMDNLSDILKERYVKIEDVLQIHISKD